MWNACKAWRTQEVSTKLSLKLILVLVGNTLILKVRYCILLSTVRQCSGATIYEIQGNHDNFRETLLTSRTLKLQTLHTQIPILWLITQITDAFPAKLISLSKRFLNATQMQDAAKAQLSSSTFVVLRHPAYPLVLPLNKVWSTANAFPCHLCSEVQNIVNRSSQQSTIHFKHLFFTHGNKRLHRISVVHVRYDTMCY